MDGKTGLGHAELTPEIGIVSVLKTRRKPMRFTPRRGRTTLERFAEKCAFDPYTGCVMWIGGQTAGHGHSEPYGRFRDADGRPVLAHRWAAQHIHGFEIDGYQVDHCCPAGPSTLCVQHVQPETAQVNRALQAERKGLGRCFQSLQRRQYWLFVWKGLEELPARIVREESGVPWFDPPAWLAPYLALEKDNDCPF